MGGANSAPVQVGVGVDRGRLSEVVPGLLKDAAEPGDTKATCQNTGALAHYGALMSERLGKTATPADLE